MIRSLDAHLDNNTIAGQCVLMAFNVSKPFLYHTSLQHWHRSRGFAWFLLVYKSHTAPLSMHACFYYNAEMTEEPLQTGDEISSFFEICFCYRRV